MFKVFSLVIMAMIPSVALSENAPRPPQAPPIGVLPDQAPPIPSFSTYSEARSQSIKSGKPLVVFVGIEPRKIHGACVCRWDGYSNTRTGIVVGVPKDGDVYSGVGDKEFLSSKASDDEVLKRVEEIRPTIRRALEPSAYSPASYRPAVSFSPSFSHCTT